MGASITLAGESLIAQKQASREALQVARFVLADVPGLDTTLPVDRAAGKPPEAQIVHTVAVTREGYLNPNQVVYSLMMSSEVGDFDFNWMGLETSEGVLLITAYIPRQQKRKEIPPLQSGNNLTRNIVLEYDGAKSLTGIEVPASTWQFDFTAQFASINRDIAQIQEKLARKVDLDTWNPPAVVSLDGPVLVYPGSANTYKITDYNRFSIFTATTTVGTVTIVADVLTLNIPANAPASVVSLVVSRDNIQAKFSVPVGDPSIVPPTMTSPANGAVGVSLDTALTSSPFSVFPAGYDVHKATRWQLATDANFTALLFDRTSTAELTSIRPADYDVLLPPGKKIYERAIHIGDKIQSANPAAASFNTATVYIRRPSISFPLDGQQNVTAGLTITSDAFSVYGGNDTHAQSRFQLLSVVDGSVVQDSGWQSANLVSYKPPIQPARKTQYDVRVKYKGLALGETDWSPLVRFLTGTELQGSFTQLLTGIPSARSGLSLTEIGGILYAYGGSIGSDSSYNELWSYNPATNIWTQKASAPTEARRYSHVAVALGGQLYITGGAIHSTAFASTTYRYNPATDTWTKMAGNFGGKFAAGVVASGLYYFIGGDLYGTASAVMRRYTPASDKWDDMAPMPVALNGIVATEFEGNIYVFGGNNRSAPLRYSIATNTWSVLPVGGPSGTTVFLSGAARIDEKFYIFGGRYTSGDLNTLWCFDLRTQTWSLPPTGATGRWSHGAASYLGKMYITGGMFQNDFWSIS